MPDTKPLQKYFGQPGAQKPGCGFPVGRLWGMFDARCGLLVQWLVAPLRTHDGAQVRHFPAELRAGDIVVGDRALASYCHLAELVRHKLHGLFRIHQRQLVSFRQDCKLTGQQPQGTTAKYASTRLVKKLGKYDQLVEYRKPTTRPKWMTAEEYAALPETLIVREIRFRTKTKHGRVAEITLVTTLLKRPRKELRQSPWPQKPYGLTSCHLLDCRFLFLVSAVETPSAFLPSSAVRAIHSAR